jgi:hypothetical protein
LGAIELLILPANTTHLVQMYDVGVAGTFKKCLKKVFTKLLKINRPDFTNDNAFYRYVCINSMIEAWNSSATGELCRSSARKTGMLPFNVEAVLSGQHITIEESIEDIERFKRIKQRKSLNINSRLLTTDDFIAEYLNYFPNLMTHKCIRFDKDLPYLPQIETTLQSLQSEIR